MVHFVAMKRCNEAHSCFDGRYARWHPSARARQPAMPRERAVSPMRRAANRKRGRADPSISAAVRDATRAASARVELRRVPVEPQRVWREHVTATTAAKVVCNAHACVVRCGGASEPRAVFALGSVRCVRLCTKEEHAALKKHLEGAGARGELGKLTHVVEIQDIAWCARGCTAVKSASLADRAVGTATDVVWTQCCGVISATGTPTLAVQVQDVSGGGSSQSRVSGVDVAYRPGWRSLAGNLQHSGGSLEEAGKKQIGHRSNVAVKVFEVHELVAGALDCRCVKAGDGTMTGRWSCRLWHAGCCKSAPPVQIDSAGLEAVLRNA